jgi:hypothetical protein
VVLLGTAGAGLWLLIDAVLGELRNFLLRLPALTEGLSRLIGQAGDWLQSYAGRFGVVPGAWLTGLLEDLPAQLSQLLPALSGGAWGFLSGLAAESRNPAFPLHRLSWRLFHLRLVSRNPSLYREELPSLAGGAQRILSMI